MKLFLRLAGLSLLTVLTLCLTALAADVTLTPSEEDGTIPGTIQISLPNNFPNASIVSIKGSQTETKAVVANGEISFYSAVCEPLTISTTGETVADCFRENLQTQTMRDLAYRGTGTVEDPYVVFSTFANTPMELFKLQAAWKGYNVLAGYSGMEYYNDSDYLRSYDSEQAGVLRCEDRDPQTGALRGAFVVDGHRWMFVNGRDKGPYYMNYLLDPADRFLTSGYALDNNYLYSSDTVSNVIQRKKAAVQTIKAIRNSKTSSLFFNYRMRDYSGPILFEVNVGVNGKFQPGDEVSIHYLLGAGDRNLYHQVKPSPEDLLQLEPTYRKFYQDKGLTFTVDENGSLPITLYNGGYFELRNETSIKEHRDVKVIESTYKTVHLTDVDTTFWAYDAIHSQIQKNYMLTVSGQFKPACTINRGDFIKTLILSADIPVTSHKDLPFLDVPIGSPYRDYVYTAYSKGITSGMTATQFGVERPLTREMVAVLICKALNISPTTDSFADADTFAPWAKGYIGACQEAGYVNGYPDGTYRPQEKITRAQAAVIMERLCENIDG